MPPISENDAKAPLLSVVVKTRAERKRSYSTATWSTWDESEDDSDDELRSIEDDTSDDESQAEDENFREGPSGRILWAKADNRNRAHRRRKLVGAINVPLLSSTSPNPPNLSLGSNSNYISDVSSSEDEAVEDEDDDSDSDDEDSESPNKPEPDERKRTYTFGVCYESTQFPTKPNVADSCRSSFARSVFPDRPVPPRPQLPTKVISTEIAFPIGYLAHKNSATNKRIKLESLPRPGQIHVHHVVHGQEPTMGPRVGHCDPNPSILATSDTSNVFLNGMQRPYTINRTLPACPLLPPPLVLPTLQNIRGRLVRGIAH